MHQGYDNWHACRKNDRLKNYADDDPLRHSASPVAAVELRGKFEANISPFQKKVSLTRLKFNFQPINVTMSKTKHELKLKRYCHIAKLEYSSFLPLFLLAEPASSMYRERTMQAIHNSSM